ncbi:MAG: hypothetical protein DRP84_04070 [Spirochaetes bacterium]|nr:MAG: hypothetical protein DRP84_04070 [Spirochaetota bacterium]
MSDQLSTSFLLKPLAIGLYIGIFIAIIVFIREKIVQHRLKKEIEKLKAHIQTKLEIEAESNERRKKEIEELKKQNENLRIMLQNYIEKPGRKILRQLHLYQKAIEILTVKAPGFAQSWQSALEEAGREMRLMESGIIPFIKKIIPWRKGESVPKIKKDANKNEM